MAGTRMNAFVVPPEDGKLLLGWRRRPDGGGREGNVTAATLSVLKSTIAGIDTVTNPDAATGGVDAEIITHARQRASMEIRSRYRAVTAEDFEFMAGEASPRVARAVCIPPADGGAVPLHIVPHVFPADRQLAYPELVPDEELMQEVAEYLDEVIGCRALFATHYHELTRLAESSRTVANYSVSAREIGDDVVVHRHVLLDDRGGIRIGNNASVSDFANVYSHTHSLADGRFVTAPQTIIGDGVRVTYHATVLAGVHLLADAMLGSMAVATRDIDGGKVALGIPAKPKLDKPPKDKRPEAPVTGVALAMRSTAAGHCARGSA